MWTTELARQTRDTTVWTWLNAIDAEGKVWGGWVCRCNLSSPNTSPVFWLNIVGGTNNQTILQFERGAIRIDSAHTDESGTVVTLECYQTDPARGESSPPWEAKDIDFEEVFGRA